MKRNILITGGCRVSSGSHVVRLFRREIPRLSDRKPRPPDLRRQPREPAGRREPSELHVRQRRHLRLRRHAQPLRGVRHRRGDPSRGRKPRRPLDPRSVHFRADQRDGDADAVAGRTGALERHMGRQTLPPHLDRRGLRALPFDGTLFTEQTRYDPHSPYSASKASSDHFVRAFHDTYGFPAVVTNCSNNYGPYRFPRSSSQAVTNNIRHRKAAAGLRPGRKASATGSTSRTTPGPSTRYSTGDATARRTTSAVSTSGGTST